jgi:hypothetical protein
MACPTLDPNQPVSSEFLLQIWAAPNGTKGVMDDTLPIDPSTGIIQQPAIQAKVQSLVAAGRLATGTDATAHATNQALYDNLTAEYCWYEQRYIYALQQFLKAATVQQSTGTQGGQGAQAATAQQWLTLTQTLNKRTNSVLQILTYLPKQFANHMDTVRSSMITANAELSDKLRRLQASYAHLNRNDALLDTQKEMVRYTEEKNHYTQNRLIVWTALNILALGAIFYVYRA